MNLRRPTRQLLRWHCWSLRWLEEAVLRSSWAACAFFWRRSVKLR